MIDRNALGWVGAFSLALSAICVGCINSTPESAPTECALEANDTQCDADGSACTPDTCQEGECVLATQVECGGSEQCDPQSGECGPPLGLISCVPPAPPCPVECVCGGGLCLPVSSDRSCYPLGNPTCGPDQPCPDGYACGEGICRRQ